MRLACLLAGCGLGSAIAGCGGILDAGSNRGAPLLPVSAENPVILCNDGAYDNWQGEYALLLAQSGGPKLAGIVVSTGGTWSDLGANFSAWSELVTRARDSGLVGLPDPIQSASAPLAKPGDGAVDSTLPNDSEGARFIVETSMALSAPGLPIAVVTGGRLTDVADAYLIDPTVVDRVVVVSSLGTAVTDAGEPSARMDVPNGEMDRWADAIVAEKFRYVQVSAYYDQLTDVPDDRLADLPDNPLGTWMAAKQPELLGTPLASDQVGIIAVAIPAFTEGVTRVSPSSPDGDVVMLTPDQDGQAWLVTESDGAKATGRLWELLFDPGTWGG